MENDSSKHPKSRFEGEKVIDKLGSTGRSLMVVNTARDISHQKRGQNWIRNRMETVDASGEMRELIPRKPTYRVLLIILISSIISKERHALD